MDQTVITVPVEKEVEEIDKNREEITKNISYILQFIDSARFMASSLSYLVNNISKEFLKLIGNMGAMIKSVKLVELHTKHEAVFLNRQTVKMI